MTNRLQTPSDIFAAKAAKGLSFEQLANALGRSEVSVAALFYGQAQASPEDAERLSRILEIDISRLAQLRGFPDRGHVMGNQPPVEPLQYRLWEVIKVYGSPLSAKNYSSDRLAGTALLTRP